MAGDGLGRGEGHALGHEFADDDGGERDGHADEDEGDGAGVGADERPAGEIRGDIVGERDAADGAGEGGDERDAHLHGGEETRRLLGDREGAGGERIAILGEFAEPGLAGGNHGELGHGEEAVDEQEREQEQELRED